MDDDLRNLEGSLRPLSFSEVLKDFLKPYLDENTKNLRAIKTEIENIKGSIDSNHELLTHRIGVLESILDKIKDNTKQ